MIGSVQWLQEVRDRDRESNAGRIAAKALLTGGGEIVAAIAAVYSPNVVARASIKLRAIEILLEVYLDTVTGYLEATADEDPEVGQ